MAITYEGSVKVAVVNFKAIVGDKSANLENMEEFIVRAGDQGVGLIVFPETALSGWALTPKTAKALGEKIPGPSTDRISDLAARHDIYVIFGMPELGDENRIYDSAAVVGPEGIIGGYRKVHPHPVREGWAQIGMEYPVFETRYGPLGIVICREMFLYPEVSRIYAVKGVRILINPFAGPDFGGGPEDTQNFVLTQLASRVHENQSFVLSANLVGAQGPMVMVGYSSIMGPSPKPELMQRHMYAGPASMTEQEILIATLDLSIVNSRPPGVATVFEDRVPRTYSALV